MIFKTIKWCWCKSVHSKIFIFLAAGCVFIMARDVVVWQRGYLNPPAELMTGQFDPARESRRREARGIVFRQFEDSLQEMKIESIRPE